MKEQTAQQKSWLLYRQRIESVVQYIHDNPAAKLDNNCLAEIACLSVYHWHRIYRAVTGETATATVRRVRMHLAAGALLKSDKPVSVIGQEVGYPDIHSFTRAFKNYYGEPPATFRKLHQHFNKTIAQRDKTSAYDHWPVRIEHRSEQMLWGLSHHGDYLKIGKTFEKVWSAANAGGWASMPPVMMGVYFQDPDSVEPEELQSFAGIGVKQEDSPAPGLTSHLIAAGKYAVLTYTGPYAALDGAYHWLYRNWLSQSKESLRDAPCNEQYMNSVTNTPESELVTEICLPLE